MKFALDHNMLVILMGDNVEFVRNTFTTCHDGNLRGVAFCFQEFAHELFKRVTRRTKLHERHSQVIPTCSRAVLTAQV